MTQQVEEFPTPTSIIIEAIVIFVVMIVFIK